MPLTPVYNIPYQAVTATPHGPNGQQGIAEAVETELARIDAAIAAAAAAQKPHAILRSTAAQAVVTSTFVALTFNVEDYDSHNGHSTVTNTSRYTAQVAGAYHLDGGNSWAANVTGSRTCRWAKNGSAIAGSLAPGFLGNASSTVAARPIIVRLDVGDYVEYQAYQSSGGTINTSVSPAENQATMHVAYVSS